MNPNAMAFSFFAGNPFQGRMDLAPGGQPPKAQGFGVVTSQAADVPTGDFKAMYQTIAAMNAQALTVTAANAPSQPSQLSAPSAGSLDLAAVLKALLDQADGSNQLQSASGDGTEPDPANISGLLGIALQDAAIVPPEIPAGQAGKESGSLADLLTIGELVSGQPGGQSGLANAASEIISQALADVSEAFHLSIDPGLKSLSLSGASDDVVKQFAEILYALKKIAGVLEEAVGKNQDLDLGTQVMDTAKAREMALLVQVRVFRIEIGVSMLGLGDRVQSDLAQKLELPFSGNVPQAMDPVKVTMPQTQLEKLFGPLLSESSPSIAVLAQKIRELCAKFGQGCGLQGQVKVPAAARGVTVTETIRIAQAKVVSSIDPQGIVKSLNPDAKAILAGQNAQAAAQAEQIDLSLGALKVSSKAVAPGAIDAVKELLPFGDTSVKSLLTQSFTGIEAKSGTPVYKTLDESVMSQIADRLHTALRTGIHEIRIQLRPESLGEVRLRIRVEGDVVFARIQVESQQVKQIVESSMQFLKDSLSQQHLQTGSLEVNVGGGGWDRKPGEPVHQIARGDGAMSSETEGENNAAEAETCIGVETGRKFGANTIEYFA